MIERRDMLIGALALMAAAGRRSDAEASLTRAADGRWPALETLVGGAPKGRRVTLLHLPDLHAALHPQFLRPMRGPIGDGAFLRRPPYLSGDALLRALDLEDDDLLAAALSDTAFDQKAQALGPMGGVDRIASVLAAVRALNPKGTLVLDGGDGWQGSALALADRGAGVAAVQAALGFDATTVHWELICAPERLAALPYPVLAANLAQSDGARPFKPHARFDRHGTRIAVIGLAYPHLAAAHGKPLAGGWQTALDLAALDRLAADLRDAGHGLVVVLSHCGFDADLEIATYAPHVNVVLSAHGHFALPAPVVIGRTVICAAGSHGRFVGRLDLDMRGDELRDFDYQLIPVYADAIAPDAKLAAMVKALDAAAPAELAQPLARTTTTLARMSALPDTADWLIGESLRRRFDAEIALTPGHRWGPGVAAGGTVTRADVAGWTAIPGATAWVTALTGAQIKATLEASVHEQLGRPRAARLGEDPLRAIGLRYGLAPGAAEGDRIREPVLASSGTPLEDGRHYRVAGWSELPPLRAAGGASLLPETGGGVAAAEAVAAGVAGMGLVDPPDTPHVMLK